MMSTEATRTRGPIRCVLGIHRWTYLLNDRHETYYVCRRCGTFGMRDCPAFGSTFEAAAR